MRNPEKELIRILKKAGVDFTSSLPCEKIKNLLTMIEGEFFHVPLTREEEGVGISAGASLAGRRPAMFVQSSGTGNMLNALLSLTGFYELPLAIFISRRGIYKEKIEAQVPMGRRLPDILRGAGISYSVISADDDFQDIEKNLARVYRKNVMHAFLLSPEIWEKSVVRSQESAVNFKGIKDNKSSNPMIARPDFQPKLTRYEILKTIAPYLDSKAVICNLGIPSKELFHIKQQPSNFYMLGSMGMVLPIGLGISLTTDRDVVVIDGDGSILMNPGTLATAAYFSPGNLTILAIDNGSYGSTGDQSTLTRSCVDLGLAARGFGIKNTFRVSSKKQLQEVLRDKEKGLRFIHALGIPGNKDVPNIPLHHLDIKRQIQEFLRRK